MRDDPAQMTPRQLRGGAGNLRRPAHRSMGAQPDGDSAAMREPGGLPPEDAAGNVGPESALSFPHEGDAAVLRANDRAASVQGPETPGPSLNALADGFPPEPVAIRIQSDGLEWTFRTLFRSRSFWALTIGFLFASTLYTLIEVYQFPILTSRGIDGATAAWFISIYSLSAALSKFGWGYLADRVDLRRLILLALCANSLALATLAFATALPVIWFYTLLGGASGGGQSSLLPALIAQKFGHRSFGTVAGLFLPLSMIAPAIAVPLAGFVFDAIHSYTPVFVATAALAVVSGTALLKLPRGSTGRS
jgi:hypothetical protein